MNVLAWDLSLTSTGVCMPDRPPFCIKPKFGVGVERLAYLRWEYERITEEAQPDLIVVESLPTNTGGRFDTSGLAMAHATFQLKMYDLGLDFTYVNPAQLKRYATGLGNAKKDLMLAEAVRRLGYQGSSNDEADALWLWEMGVDHVTGEHHVPDAHRAPMRAIEWRMAR